MTVKQKDVFIKGLKGMIHGCKLVIEDNAKGIQTGITTEGATSDYEMMTGLIYKIENDIDDFTEEENIALNFLFIMFM